MFKCFDLIVSSNIDFEEFIIGISKCVKLSVDEQIQFLFNIYDISGN